MFVLRRKIKWRFLLHIFLLFFVFLFFNAMRIVPFFRLSFFINISFGFPFRSGEKKLAYFIPFYLDIINFLSYHPST